MASNKYLKATEFYENGKLRKSSDVMREYKKAMKVQPLKLLIWLYLLTLQIWDILIYQNMY